MVLGLALSGCTIRQLVREQAAQDFSCPESKVQTFEGPGYSTRAVGCGRQALYNSSARSPIGRASFDLSCPVEQLDMVDLGDNSIGVQGCGKRVTYAWVDQAWVGTPR